LSIGDPDQNGRLMAIKLEAERYFAHAKGERELALRLDELFDITFRDTRGQLSFWLAAPKNHAMERFGLHQEVLTIYSPHPKTDARVMTAIENVARSPEFKHRVEKVANASRCPSRNKGWFFIYSGRGEPGMR
jgi:hypothetical protein